MAGSDHAARSAAGEDPDGDWASVAFTLAPGANATIGVRSTGDEPIAFPVAAGIKLYREDGQPFVESVWIEEEPRTFSWWRFAGGERGNPQLGWTSGAWRITDNGTTLESNLSFHSPVDEPLTLRAMLWTTHDPGSVAWRLASEADLVVSPARTGTGTVLVMKADFTKDTDPDVPLLNQATGLDMLQYTHHHAAVTVGEGWHGTFFRGQVRGICVDVEGVPMPYCHWSQPAGYRGRSWTEAPAGGSEDRGPAGTYTFHHREYERFPYACAPGKVVCAGERQFTGPYEPPILSVTGADSTLATFD